MSDKSALSLDRDDRLAEVLDAYLEAQEGGASPDVDDFLARYPDLAGELRECLASLAFIRRAGNLSVAGDAPAEGDATGGVLGDFRIVREVGKGGMGVVYEAEQISLRRRVALKVLPFAATMDARHLQRFHNEAQAAACLHHTNIVPVFSVGCERGVHFYAMQFIEGLSLDVFLRGQRRDVAADEMEDAERTTDHSGAKGGPPLAATTVQTQAKAMTQSAPRDAAYLRRVAEWGTAAAEALEHAHSLGIVHRDIKPANLLIDATGRLWITDFGLARLGGDAGLTLSGDVLGTLRYMSPEQAMAKHGLVDHRTDVYSLGVTLYELLTLRPAIDGDDREELRRKIASEEPMSPRRLNQAIPADLEIVVQKAMAKELSERYATAQELADDLRHWLEDRPIRARRPPLRTRLARWSRRHKPWVVAVAGLVLAVFLLGGAVLVREMWHRAAIERAVEPALERAELLQEQEWYEEALGILAVAEGQLDGRGLGALRQRIEQRKRDVEMLMRLREASLQFMFVPDEATGWDRGGADRKYGEAFAWYDLDVTTLDPQEAARRVRASAIKDRLIAGIDDWAYMRDKKGDAALRALADSADDNEWRRLLRGAIGRRDRAMVEELARQKDLQNQPLSNVMLLIEELSAAKSWASAERLLRQVQQRYPRSYEVNRHLGHVLFNKEPKDLAGSAHFLQIAVFLQPQIPTTYFNLGACLNQQEKFSEALGVLRKAVELWPNSATVYVELAAALRGLGRRKEAFANEQKAIEINPNYATPHWNAGLYLANEGRFAESLAALKRSLAIGWRDPGLNAGRAQWVRQAELFAKLDVELPKFLAGEVRPADAAECLALALLCHRYKKRYAAAARFYADAFAADAKLAASPLATHYRYYAACSATQASAGEGQDAKNLPDKARETLRRQALDWLRADLAVYRRLLDMAPGKPRPRVQEDMQIWQKEGDSDLASVHRLEALARLSEGEQGAWLKLWADVADTLDRAKGNAAPQNKSAPK